MTKAERIAALDKLLDDAVWVGRMNWDGYYGCDNTFHMNEIREGDLYKKFVREVPDVQ